MSSALCGALLFGLPGLYVAFRGRGASLVLGLTLLTLVWIFARPDSLFWASAVAIVVSAGGAWVARFHDRYVISIVGGLLAGAFLMALAYHLGTFLQVDRRPVLYRHALPYIVPVFAILAAAVATLAVKLDHRLRTAATAVIGAVFALQGTAILTGGFLIHGAMAGLKWATDPSRLFGWKGDVVMLHYVPIYGHGALPDSSWLGYFAFLLPLAAIGYFIQTRLAPASSDTPELNDVTKGA